MLGTRAGVGRMLAIGVGLAVVLLLAVVGEARAGQYSVAQCGWYVGADADWADSTGGAKFRPDSYCVPPPGSDPFDGAHVKSFGREGAGTVSGNRFARWRWLAPAGTGITQIRASWWQSLHDGMEQRLGALDWSGNFVPFLTTATTDVSPREFVANYWPPVAGLEDRLLCARAESKWCSLDPVSWSALRGLTLTMYDGRAPEAWLGGELLGGGWRRGVQSVGFAGGNEEGSGIRSGETYFDGARIDVTEYPCEKAYIDGEWRATRMQPCQLAASGGFALDTARFSDGTHRLRHCATDFSGNLGCSAEYLVGIDNNPPAQPPGLLLAGGEGWHRVNDFDLAWANPDQGAASPIAGVYWRIGGPNEYDTGVRFEGGRDVEGLADLALPAAGIYTLQLWLCDEAGNTAPATAIGIALRYDDVPPRVAFANEEGGEGQQIRAEVADPLSGPGGGQISYRRLDGGEWTELATRLQPAAAGSAQLTARTPELAPGTYLFRAEAVDGAGNSAQTTLRGDGTQMAVRLVSPATAPGRGAPGSRASSPSPRARTRLFARLRGEPRGEDLGSGRRGNGDSLTVPFGASAILSGRLTRAGGAALPGRELRVVSRPSRGALAQRRAETVISDEHGGFQLRLEPGPSRRISVLFAADDGLEAARRSPLELRVRSGVTLAATPLALRTGQLLRLSGRVRDREAPLPRRGKLVAVQYLETATGRWRPVLVARSDHDGRFHARYRFRYLSGAAAIRLRATALAEERWPYAPGSSAPLTVRVSGR
jgi:hypothetical protein